MSQNITKSGSEFQINTYTAGKQTNPSVGTFSDGRYVVVWQSDGQDGSNYGVFGQIFDSSGAKIGAEFQVNTYTTNKQWAPEVGTFNDGTFVVVWESYGQDGSGWGAHGQKFNSDGTKLGAEFQIHTYTTNDQGLPSVGTFSDGSFVIVWHGVTQEDLSFGVCGQRFDSSGARVGSEFLINTYTTSHQAHPNVGTFNDGNFVVVWHSLDQDGSLEGAYGQRFDSSGAKLGGEFQINTHTVSNQRAPIVGTFDDGNFVVVWHSLDQDGSSWGVHGQRFDSSVAKLGAEFQINTYTLGTQGSPVIGIFGDDSFIVVWDSYEQDGSSGGIYGQRFDSSGVKVGSEFQINTYTTNNQWIPSVGTFGNGGVVVAWTSNGQDGSGFGIFGQRFDGPTPLPCSSALVIPGTNITRVGEELLVNTHTMQEQISQKAATFSDGSSVVVWQSNDQDGSGCGVYTGRDMTQRGTKQAMNSE